MDLRSRTFLYALILEILVNLGITFYGIYHFDQPVWTYDMYSAWISSDLKGIATKLEEYKKEHGTYPDSLRQLNTKYHTINITDAMLKRNPFDKNLIYYYRKESEIKFTLLSTGWDAIPFTNDDILPGKDTIDKRRELLARPR